MTYEEAIGVLFPAHAGVILVSQSVKQVNKTVPRTRGGDPVWQPLNGHAKHCSPHTRG